MGNTNGNDKYKAKIFDIRTGLNVVLFNEKEAVESDMFPGDRVNIISDHGSTVAMVDVTKTMVDPGEIVFFLDVAEEIHVKKGEKVRVTPAGRSPAVELIKKKMDGGSLNYAEIKNIIDDLMDKKLSDVELASFIASVYIRGLNSEETVGLTKAVVESGETLQLPSSAKPIVDKHCTGGVAGNRTTMLIVPIMAASGLYMPKTSSRSITSAAGTADTMEVLCDVELRLDEMRDIVMKSKGCIVWGGSMNLAAADDKLIRIRHPLSLDPTGVMVASVLAKKKSVGADYVTIDIPVGRGAKIQSTQHANELAKQFINVSGKLGMKTEVFITYGRDPVGKGIGPSLECMDVLKALQGNGPGDLVEKSCRLAGALLELCGKTPKGKGYASAVNTLKSGKAYEKFKEIIELQGGNPEVKASDLPLGKYRHVVKAEKDGRIHLIDNHAVNRLARAAGSPKSKGAGVLLNIETGDKVKKGQVLFEIISESEAKLGQAVKLLDKYETAEFEKVILGKMGEAGVFQWKPKGTC